MGLYPGLSALNIMGLHSATDIPCFSCFYDPVQAIHDLIKGRLIIPHMVNVEIHIIHAEIVKAFINHLFNILLSGNSRLYILFCAGKELGCHHKVFSFAIVP